MRDWVHLAWKLKKTLDSDFSWVFLSLRLGYCFDIVGWLGIYDWAVSPFDTSLCPRIRCILPKSRKTRSETVSFQRLKDLCWSCLIPGRVKNTRRRRKKPKNSCMQLLASRCLISKMLVSDIFSIYFLTFSHIFSVFCMCPASNRRKFTATPYTTGPGGARTGGDAFDAPSLLAKTLRELRPGASAEFLGKSWDVSMVLWCPMDIYEYLLISLDIYGLWTGIGIVFGENSGKLWENWYAIICLRCGMWLCRKRAMFRNWRGHWGRQDSKMFRVPCFRRDMGLSTVWSQEFSRLFIGLTMFDLRIWSEVPSPAIKHGWEIPPYMCICWHMNIISMKKIND